MFWIFHSALSVQEDIFISFLSVRLMERQVGREANGSRNKKTIEKIYTVYDFNFCKYYLFRTSFCYSCAYELSNVRDGADQEHYLRKWAVRKGIGAGQGKRI